MHDTTSRRTSFDEICRNRAPREIRTALPDQQNINCEMPKPINTTYPHCKQNIIPAEKAWHRRHRVFGSWGAANEQYSPPPNIYHDMGTSTYQASRCTIRPPEELASMRSVVTVPLVKSEPPSPTNKISIAKCPSPLTPHIPTANKILFQQRRRGTVGIV